MDTTANHAIDAHSELRLPHSPQTIYLCPHCGGPLDLRILPFSSAAPGVDEPSADQPSSPAAPSSTNLPSRLIGGALDRWFPITSVLNRSEHVAPVPSPRSAHMLSRWVRSALLFLPLMLTLLWLLWQRVAGGAMPGASLAPNPAMPTNAPALIAPDARAPAWFTLDHAAVLAVVTQYNAADPQAAATLSLDPIRPFLDPAGPLMQRRSRELATRQATGATHMTRLLRWAVGAIEIDAAGTLATIVTQETWENQEAGAAAPQTATVRITYTLRRANTHSSWLIADAVSTIL